MQNVKFKHTGTSKEESFENVQDAYRDREKDLYIVMDKTGNSHSFDWRSIFDLRITYSPK